MNYLSLFSGIEAASVAWSNFNWKCVGVSEIDPFASAVLAHRYPTVPNLGDVTQITQGQLDELKQKHTNIDLVCGGSPCQSFSVAGLRKGLSDPRGNLMYEYIRVIEAVRPKWLIWENVPGALSADKGQAFATLLQSLAELGYFLSWRVLDAQHFGVPQRRRRVFLVGCSDPKTSPFKVLFESESGEGDTAPSGEEGEEDSPSAESGSGKHGRGDRHEVYNVTFNDANGRRKDRPNGGCYINKVEKSCSITTSGVNNTVIVDRKCFTQNSREEVRYIDGAEDQAGSINASQGSHQTNYIAEYFEHHPNDSRVKGPKDIANAVTKRYGTGGGNVPLIREYTPCDLYNTSVDESGTVASITTQSNATGSGPRLIEHEIESKLSSTLQARDYKGPSADDFSGGAQKLVLEKPSRVRRLTPLECERLQGFPDRWTEIPYRKKTAEKCPTSPRYKALGNSMAVPVMRWIGNRIRRLETPTQKENQ